MIDLNLIRSFVAVAETGSVSRAAARLGLPKSTVSRHVARLEADLSEPLVARRADGLALLDHGRRLYDRVRAPLHLLDDLAPASDATPARGHVRLLAARFLGRHVLAPLLIEFSRGAPDVAVDFRCIDRFAELDPAAFDLAVTIGPQVVPDCDQTALRPVSARLYAAPALFRKDAAPAEPSEVEAWPFLAICGLRGKVERLTLTAPTGETADIAPRVRIEANELDPLLLAAQSALGIAQLPEFAAASHVASGALVEVLPGWTVERPEVWLQRPRRRRNDAARALARYLADKLA